MNNQVTSSHEQPYWFGEIPPTWDVKRIKALFSLRDERNYLPLSEVNLISLYTNIGVVQHSDLTHTTGNRAQNADGYKIVKPDDIIVNILLCWMGAIGHCAYDGVTSPAYDIYTPKTNADSRFYHYLFRTKAFSQQCYRAGKGIMAMRWRTYSPQFSDIKVPVPPVSEQRKIVQFLDWKTSDINKLIKNHRKAIAYYRELKLRLIDEAVICGLRECARVHSDRWNVMYPKHWSIKRIREDFSFGRGLSITKADLQETGVPVISYGQIHSKTNSGVGLCNDLFRFVDEGYLSTNSGSLVRRGDFIFADTSEDLAGCGNCVYIDWDNTIFAGYHSIIMHHNQSTDNKYYAYLFQSPTWRYQIRKKCNAVKVYSITQQTLKDAYILIPPVDEQREIVEHLDAICKKMDAVIAKITEKISSLNDMKNTLIFNVATGKVNINNFDIPDYEYVDEDPDSVDSDEETEEQEGDE